MGGRIPILLFEQLCSTEATIGFVPNIAQFFSYPEVPCIFVFSLMCCLQSNDPFFLQHSMLSRSELMLQIFSVWFPICATESRTACFIGTNMNSQGSLIAWTTGQMFRCFGKIQLVLGQVWPLKTNRFALCCVISIKNRTPSSSNTCLSCSFSRGVLTVSVFLLHILIR